MRLRGAVMLIAVLPLLLAGLAVSWVIQQRSKVVAEMQFAAVQPVVLTARKTELQNYVSLARSVIAHLVHEGKPDADAQAEALEILRKLEFGNDGYFFVYDFDGNNLMHPRLPELQGKNLINVRDRQGNYTIQRLLALARAGGGYMVYEWARPNTGRIETKLGYVEAIEDWHWMLGTDAYVDEPEQARQRIEESAQQAVSDTLALVGAITVLTTLAVVVLALGVNLNEQRKADAKLREMARQIVMSQEAERARVARELHDSVSQWLVSVKYVFESALERARTGGTDPHVTSTLDGGVRRLREVLGEVRRISHDLRPALLDDLGLPRALEHLAGEWSGRTGVEVKTEIEDVEQVPEALATALFRIAQEALGNVERHAQAHHVRLALGRELGRLRLTIADDGKGFDARQVLQAPRSGLGLTHMRERVESLGGRFSIESGAEGTQLSAIFPSSAWSS